MGIRYEDHLYRLWGCKCLEYSKHETRSLSVLSPQLRRPLYHKDLGGIL